MAYEEFFNANPDFGSQMNALTSESLNATPKTITFTVMAPSIKYRRPELFGLAQSVCISRKFPVIDLTVWRYFDGQKSCYESTLKNIGAIEECGPKDGSKKYRKTEAGRLIFEPVTRLALEFVASREWSKKRGNKLLESIFGTPRDSGSGDKHGYILYLLTKLLHENEDRVFKAHEVVEELGPIASHVAIYSNLRSFGSKGFLKYISKQGRKNGKRTSGWAKFIAKERINYEDALDAALKENEKFHYWKNLRKAVEYINQHISKDVSNAQLAKKTGMHVEDASRVLNILKRAGYLTTEFSGFERSKVKANRYTHLLFTGLFQPIAESLSNLDKMPVEAAMKPVTERLRFSGLDKDFLDAINTNLAIYQQERTKVGKKGGEEARREIIAALLRLEEAKPIEIKEEIGDIAMTRVTTHLLTLRRKGVVINNDGIYRVDKDKLKKLGVL